MYELFLRDSQQIPWDEIDQVVFDIGNVLVDYNPRRFVSVLFPDEPALQERIIRNVYASPWWIALDRGILSREEAVTCMADTDTDLLPAYRRAVYDWIPLLLPVEEGVHAMQVCREHGKRIFLLSNYNDQTFEETREHLPYLKDVDGQIVSGYVHLLKPDPNIYMELLHTYNLTPDRTLFIDDSCANIESALQLGLRAFWCDTPQTLQRMMTRSSGD